MFKVHGPCSSLTISIIPYAEMFEGTWTLMGQGIKVTFCKEIQAAQDRNGGTVEKTLKCMTQIFFLLI